MVTTEEVIEELRFLSDRLSTQVRTVAIALIVITWGILIGKSEVALTVAGDLKRELLAIGTLALTAMFCDFLQYFFGYLNSNALRNKMEKENLKQSNYEYSDLRYRLRGFFFWAKQVVLIIAVVCFLVILVLYLWPAS